MRACVLQYIHSKSVDGKLAFEIKATAWNIYWFVSYNVYNSYVVPHVKRTQMVQQHNYIYLFFTK